MARIKSTFGSSTNIENTKEFQTIKRNSDVKTTKQVKRRRARPGVKVLREIRKYQSSTSIVYIRKLPFMRLVKEIISNLQEYRVKADAVEALKEASELYLTDLFSSANIAANHANRVTVMPKDMKLAKLMKPGVGGYSLLAQSSMKSYKDRIVKNAYKRNASRKNSKKQREIEPKEASINNITIDVNTTIDKTSVNNESDEKPIE